MGHEEVKGDDAQVSFSERSSAKLSLMFINALPRDIAHAEIVEISPRRLGATNRAPLVSRHSDQGIRATVKAPVLKLKWSVLAL